MVRASKSPKPGSTVVFSNEAGEELEVQVTGRQGEFFELEFPTEVLPCLDRFGRTPLPPYIERAANAADESTYQTVYAEVPGGGGGTKKRTELPRKLLGRAHRGAALHARAAR